MVVVIGRCIEAIPKKAKVKCIGQIEACFGGVSNYCTFKPLVAGNELNVISKLEKKQS